MSSSSDLYTRRLGLATALLVLPLSLVVHPRPAAAQSCGFSPGHTPAYVVESDLWNHLQPTDLPAQPGRGGIPLGTNQNSESRDTTWLNPGNGYTFNSPLFQWLDVSEGYIFAAVNFGMQIWDVSKSGNGPGSAEKPDRLAYLTFLSIPHVINGSHDFRQIRSIDAPTGNSDVAVMTGISSIGMVVWDTSTKSSPRIVYQDGGDDGVDKISDVQGVYATTINGRSYGFLASISSPAPRNTSGLWMYDLTRALEVGSPTPCVEKRPQVVNPACSGVFKSKLTEDGVGIVTGTGSAANGHYVAASGGVNSVSVRGVRIWNVTNPNAPTQVINALPSESVHGLAMWEQGTKVYLALTKASPNEGRIYDVSCIKTGPCSLPAPLYTFPMTGWSGLPQLLVQYSSASGTPYLYFGHSVWQSSGLQSEWLLDVSNPSAPQDVTGGDPRNGNVGQPTRTIGGTTVGYWSWYSPCNDPTGSNNVEPITGAFWGTHFYRAAFGILDVHKLRNVNPSIQVTGPAQSYPNTTVSFTAMPNNCGPLGSWTWGLDGGTPVGGTTGSTVQVKWATQGTKTVTATNPGCGGAQGSAMIQILDGAPAVDSATAAPTTAPGGTSFTFTALGVSGQPPLTVTWTVVRQAGGEQVASGSGNPFIWNSACGETPGVYVATVTVSGPGGPDATASASVTVTALPPLPAAGSWTPTNDPFTSGTVQFHANLPGGTGATQWKWDFGDGTILETTNPAEGSNPVHEYTAVNTYMVTVAVRNCVEGYRTSNPLTVEVTQIDPLVITTFQANATGGSCAGSNCVFPVGTAVSFQEVFSGSPDFFDYDWNGDGDYTDPTDDANETSAVTTHTYNTAGTYQPVMRIRRGAESVEKLHTGMIIIQTTTPPPPPPDPAIIVTGPSVGNVNTNYTFNATAQNCTPAGNGWTWTTAGGTGSSTSSSITVQWSTTGNKQVRASNSGCGSAQGTKTISITNPDTGNNAVAHFTFSPTNPSTGQTVNFDGTSSTGTITNYSWSFGDGSTALGAQVSHAFANPGAYDVTLSVVGTCGGPSCVDSETHRVTVGGQAVGCTPNSTTFCLLDNRFRVTVRYHDQHNGGDGVGRVLSFPSTDQTGAFWFFNSNNPELLVKMVDGRTLPGNAFWVFYGALTDVEYWLQVVDTKGDTNPTNDVVKEYHNLPGTICGMGDTGAFPQGANPGSSTTGGSMEGLLFASELETATGGASGTCSPSANTICLLDGRFAAEVSFYDQHNDQSGVGHAAGGTNQSGYFWFFNPANLELVVKMVDATVPFGHFWVFWGGLSDVEYTIRITDTVTTDEWTVTNNAGNICGGADNFAF